METIRQKIDGTKWEKLLKEKLKRHTENIRVQLVQENTVNHRIYPVQFNLIEAVWDFVIYFFLSSCVSTFIFLFFYLFWLSLRNKKTDIKL